jgi:uncharacterized membrane protein
MARLLYVWDRLRGSFWFVPSVFALVALGLAIALLSADRRLDGTLPTTIWLYTGGAEGARSLLSAVAASIITVVGLAFSITTVALQLAAAQLGPRLLRNFVRDPGHQIVLGTFVGTFVYCLIVLRTVRGTNGLSDDTFVPHLSVTGGVALAMLSVAVLIYFIHHAAVSMQADEVIAAVMRELAGAIDVAFPEPLASGSVDPGAVEEAPGPPSHEAVAITSPRTGYVQSMDTRRLMALAGEHDLTIRLICRPGDFVAEGDLVAQAWPALHVGDKVPRVLRSTVVVGIQRTMLQDVLFGFEQLVEIAANALSSSLRDPITAIRCIDRLGEAIDRVARRRAPSPVCRDAEGRVRLIVPVLTLDEAVAAAFDVIRAHGRPSRIVTVRILQTCTRLVAKHARRDLHVALLAQALAVLRGADALGDPLDQAAIRRHFEDFARHLRPDVATERTLAQASAA